MHNPMCRSVPSRPCRMGGPLSCRRCPHNAANQWKPLDWCRKGLRLWSDDDGLACSREGCTARRATATYEDHTVTSGGVV